MTIREYIRDEFLTAAKKSREAHEAEDEKNYSYYQGRMDLTEEILIKLGNKEITE